MGEVAYELLLHGRQRNSLVGRPAMIRIVWIVGDIVLQRSVGIRGDDRHMMLRLGGSGGVGPEAEHIVSESW